MPSLTAAHITHEACEKIGGIGSVLEGFITSPAYQRRIGRSILVGPYADHLDSAPAKRLGEDGVVRYSTVDKFDPHDLAGKFHPIEWAFNVAIVYGTRRFVLPGSDDHAGEAEVLLIDVFNINQQHVNRFKYRMAETLGMDSRRYEGDWGYEEYVRLAEPAFYALRALLSDEELPCLLFAHEYMGLPTAFKATLDGQRQFRTIFHAHECSTARAIVENHPGHDVMFYNALREARARNLYVEEVFGDRSDSARHALVSRAHMCDAIIAVGEYTAKEMHFLGDHFDHHHIDRVFNGIPHLHVDAAAVERSRGMLADYAQQLIGSTPDVLLTHVTRPVISKGIWRDLQVCHELDQRFAHENLRGVLFILTSAGGTRRPQDVRSMEAEYGWPRRHRAGYPDLVGPELEINAMIEQFNASHQRVQAVLVNQFGWSRELVGERVPAAMTFADFRRACDVEFGLATYEPFGISPLEPLGAGAICLISSACGCAEFVADVTGEVATIENVLVADYITPGHDLTLERALAIGHAERDALERRVAARIAGELVRRLPRTPRDRQRMVERGEALVSRMNWDNVIEHRLVPVLRRVLDGHRADGGTRAPAPQLVRG